MELEGAGIIHDRMTGVVATGVSCDYCSISARTSMIFPLPSSPHWAPMTAYAGILNSLVTRCWIIEVWYLPYLTSPTEYCNRLLRRNYIRVVVLLIALPEVFKLEGYVAPRKYKKFDRFCCFRSVMK